MISLMLNLLVLKTQRLEELKSFYTLLGMKFILEKHGKGPQHYAAVLDNGLVFEIYPHTEQIPPEQKIRLGFLVKDTVQITQSLGLLVNHVWENGYLKATVRDPDGRAVELTQRGMLYRKGDECVDSQNG